MKKLSDTVDFTELMKLFTLVEQVCKNNYRIEFCCRDGVNWISLSDEYDGNYFYEQRTVKQTIDYLYDVLNNRD